MQTLLESTSGSLSSSTSHADIKAASAPINPLKSEKPLVKVQLSAPSYFHSLSENETPPFKKPEREARPHLLIGTIMNEDEAIEMIAAADTDKARGLKEFLGIKFILDNPCTFATNSVTSVSTYTEGITRPRSDAAVSSNIKGVYAFTNCMDCKTVVVGEFLVVKNVIQNYNISEKSFLISFLTETIDYAAQRDFNACKLACLLTIYLNTHMHFKWYFWQSPVNLWNYFREIMIRHTIEDAPDGQEVFEPEECFDIMSHFHTMYLTNLPLVHILSFGAYRLKFLWPFKFKL